MPADIELDRLGLEGRRYVGSFVSGVRVLGVASDDERARASSAGFIGEIGRVSVDRRG